MNNRNLPVTDLQKTIAASRQHAARHRHDYIGVEHLLLASLENEHNAAAACLSQLGCELDRFIQVLEHTLKSGTASESAGCLPLTEAAERALREAMLEAHGYDRDTEEAVVEGFYQAWQRGALRAFPDTRDLLLAVLRDEASVVSRLLSDEWKIGYSQVQGTR